LSYSASALLLLLLIVSGVTVSSAFCPKTSITSTSCFQSTTTTENQIECPSQSASSALCAFPSFNDNNGDNENKNGWDVNGVFQSIKKFFSPNERNKNQFHNPLKGIGQWNEFQFFQPPLSFLEQQPTLDDHINVNANYYDGVDADDDELPAGTTLLFRIPAKQMKPGGLRLFLMFYLMGMQNTPDRMTWRADQRLMSVNVSPSNIEGFDDETSDDDLDPPEEKQYILEMLYETDRSGVLQIELRPSSKRQKQAEIRIYRCGSRPSTSYLMQESVIVDGVMDELQNICGEHSSMKTLTPSDSDPNDPEIAPEDRLLITDPPNAIQVARESLAFS